MLNAPFSIGNETPDQVEEYNYLGQAVSADSNHEKKIRRGIGMGWGALGKHSQIMNSKLPLSFIPKKKVERMHFTGDVKQNAVQRAM